MKQDIVDFKLTRKKHFKLYILIMPKEVNMLKEIKNTML